MNALKVGFLFQSVWIIAGISFIFVRKFTNSIMKPDKIISGDQIKLARYAKALGHPVRLYVLNLLADQSCCYSGDLSEELPIAKSTLSQHLKELKNAGLIQGEIEAPRIKYCLNKENWEEAKRLCKGFFRM
jgi:DNA-binding transcriptional ArsR family regulator